MEIPTTQTALVQAAAAETTAAGVGPPSLNLAVTPTARVPSLPSPNHVLVRVLAVALNPTDHKMATHFPLPGSVMGCDFCGIVMTTCPPDNDDDGDGGVRLKIGTRVCGAVWAYDPADPSLGAFAEYVVADARLLLRVPDAWTDLEGAALGGVGWMTVALSFGALGLQGRPSRPAFERTPVLVYGGGTATGTMACQILNQSGYAPIAVASAESAPLALERGASATALYTSPQCVADIQSRVSSIGRGPIRHALDCITDRESAAICFQSLYRVGGRYACLEAFDEAWRSRRTVQVDLILGYESFGKDIRIGDGDSTYSVAANEAKFRATHLFARELQLLLDTSAIRHHPMQELHGRWDGIITGLGMLQHGRVRHKKLVVRIADL